MKHNKIAFFCVGTGGHVLPVKYLISDLLNKGFQRDLIEVITDKRGAKFLSDLDIKISTINIYRSEIGKIGYFLNIFKQINTYINIKKEMDLDNTKAIFTTGSYIAPFAAAIAVIHKKTIFIQEQNIYAGLGNQIASYVNGTVFTSFPDTQNINKKRISHVGPIMSSNLTRNKIIEDKLVIGVMGGSQGSREINNLLFRFLDNYELKNIKFIHIVGPKNIDSTRIYKGYKQIDYVENMNDFYSEIDIQISRSGGGVLEPVILGIPLILLPYRYGTTSNHQQKNAEYLVNKKLAKICESYEDFESEILKLDSLKKDWFKHIKKNELFTSGNDKIINSIISELKNEI